MNKNLDYIWGCYNSTTGIGYYSENGLPDHFHEGYGRDTSLDFLVYYGVGHEAANTQEACEKARGQLREMGVTDIRSITSGCI